MLKEIVDAILSENFVWCKKTSYASKANFRKRRRSSIHKTEDDQFSESMDNAQAHKIKINCKKIVINLFKWPNLISFLIFYVCLFNVIVKCDVSVNNYNVKTPRDKINQYKINNFYGDISKWRRNLDNKVHVKNLIKSTTSSQDEDEKSEKYSMPDVLELNKYYTYHKSKDHNTNDTTTIQIIKGIYDDRRAIGYPHDLATNHYYVKRTNFNLRPETHQFDEKILKLGVLLPADPTEVFSLAKVLPIVELAIPAIIKSDGPLPGWKVLVDYRDTRCSSVYGPLAAFEFYVNGSADAFIGPGCEYVIAPVARYAGLWRIPVLTAGAQAEAFGYKHPSYMTLTRMMGSYTQAGVAIRKIFEEFNWRKLGMLYHNYAPSSGKGNSPCFMTLSAVFTVLQKKGTGNIPNIPFDETLITPEKIKELLQKLSLSTRSEYVKADVNFTDIYSPVFYLNVEPDTGLLKI